MSSNVSILNKLAAKDNVIGQVYDDITGGVSKSGGFRRIPVSKLHPSEHNSGRSMDPDYVSVIADSIESIGTLIHPLAVYVSDKEKMEYTIISGHARLNAWKQLQEKDPAKWANKPIPCIIFDKPQSEREELEEISKANIHRSTKKDRDKEVMIASDIWDNYIKVDPALKKTYTDRYLKMFKEKYKDNEAYKADEELYISRRFRPRLYYIRELTGMEASDKTIARTLDKALKKGGDMELKDIPSASSDEKKRFRSKGKIPSEKLVARISGWSENVSWYFDQRAKYDMSKESEEEREKAYSALRELAELILSKIGDDNKSVDSSDEDSWDNKEILEIME